MKLIVCISGLASLLLLAHSHETSWESRYVKINSKGNPEYIPDENGNILPDFSNVGYYGGHREIPKVHVVKTVQPTGTDNDEKIIQSAIDEVSKLAPDRNGFRGAVFLKKGVYKIPGTIRINAGGIILRGESDKEGGTKIISTAKTQVSLIHASGSGEVRETPGSRRRILNSFVPVGTHSFDVEGAETFAVGDRVILFRPGTDQWIQDLKMNQIDAREATRQWQAAEYNLHFERTIEKIEGNKVYLNNPVVMQLEAKYGGGALYKYTFEGRISNVGVENILCESEFEKDTSENHAWNAITFDKIENSWVRNVTAKFFGYSCVNLGAAAKNVTVLNSKCFEPKSLITGSRRYSFNNNGQLNLFVDCQATEGRHDFVTGARVCGPNVFYNCKARKTYSDIGPHHRWSAGTLYDNIVTDGDINVQDRGNWGTGHGWAGVTQVIWNCTAKRAAIQNPWVSGNNYCIGLKGEKYPGRLEGRPDAHWEGQNKPDLRPASLYLVQLKANGKKLPG